MISSYRPGDSPVHRVPAGVKLLALVVVGTCTALVRSPVLALVLLAAVLAGYLVAGLGLRPALVQLRPLAWVLAVVAAYHLVAEGWPTAAVVTGGVAALVLLAGLVTLTTRTSALLDVVAGLTRPLRHLGVDPERVGLLLALGVRSVPVVVGLAQQVRDAQRARGARVDARHVAVPLVVRSVRHADALAEALVARGLDD